MPELDLNSIKTLFRMGEETQADLERSVPVFVTPSQIADPEIFSKFESLVKDIIDRDDGEVALLGIKVIGQFLKQYSQLRSDNPQVYSRYVRMIALLKFINLSSNRGLPEIKELISNYLLDALRAGIKVHEKFDWVLDVYDDVLMGGEVAYELGKAMLTCNNRIGQQPLLFTKSKRQASPTIGNWLIDYRSMIAADKGGAFEQISYLKQNENARKLSGQERELLERILKLYDWLRFGTSLEEYHGQKAPASTPMPPKPPGPRPVFQKPLTIEELKKEVVGQGTPHPAYRPPSPARGEGKAEDIVSEIKREVATPELPPYLGKSEIRPPLAKPISPIRPIAPIKPIPPPVPSHQIKYLDDLKKIDVSYLRAGQLQNQISNIKHQISKLAQSNNMFMHEVIAMFQQSPLFGLYLKTGTMLMHNSLTDRSKAYEEVTGQLKKEGSKTLTLAEFEAVADLRKEIERM
ncbi:MAG: hypothetical protein HY395_00775 [Candidatus Doudnabacteria bacterium]|nr:hypothetical protein [Candidatus Doudnabacteria bacterium]